MSLLYLHIGCRRNDGPIIPRDEALLLHNAKQLLRFAETVYDSVRQETTANYPRQGQNILWIECK